MNPYGISQTRLDLKAIAAWTARQEACRRAYRARLRAQAAYHAEKEKGWRP